jgi:hypothetical protein
VTVEELVHELVGRGTLTGATLSKPRRSDPARARRVTIRPVLLRGELRYGWTYHEPSRATNENLTADETERRLVHVLGGEFRQGLLHAPDADFQILGGEKVLRRPPTRPEAPLEHDRRKRHLLEDGVPVPFLVELGVMSPEGKVLARRYGKFRQVNRFLELVADVLPALPDGPLRAVDFGSGKSYLTFALHHFLRAGHGRDVEILGLDLKEDVVARCEALARRLGAVGLRFEVGDIAGHAGLERPDLVVSLHACDTATDAALARAVRWEAAAILAVPCCQHELLQQVESASLAPLLRHGVLRERFAADVTDAARAQLLGLAGYDVQLVEFVETEHTPKNLLIRALRNPNRDTARLAQDYAEFKRALAIDPYLERALADVLPLAAA